jgi:hypothetical protein
MRLALTYVLPLFDTEVHQELVEGFAESGFFGGANLVGQGCLTRAQLCPGFIRRLPLPPNGHFHAGVHQGVREQR